MRFYQRRVQVIVHQGVPGRWRTRPQASALCPAAANFQGTLVILLAGRTEATVLAGRTLGGVLLAQELELGKQLHRRSFAMRLACRLSALTLSLALSVLLMPISPASAQKAEKFTRKLMYKENPTYPLELRHAHIGGVVRLEIVISAKGTVDSIDPVGGNPVLVEAASAAVRRWRYVPADGETTTLVQITFDPLH